MKFQNRIDDTDRLLAEIAGHRPLSKHAREQLKEYYRVGLTYSSNALEGNSLTETETKVVLEDGITIGGKLLRDHYEAIGHSEAFDLLYRLVKKADISERHILELHKLFYARIDPKTAGRYRKVGVVVSGATISFPKPAELQPLMQAFVDEIPGQRDTLHPIAFAAWLHIRLVTIHPFIDGNGRTARLLMNLALMRAGYPVTIIPPVIRGAYLDALKASNQGDDQPFINLLSSMVWEGQRDYLRLLESLEE